MTPRESFKIGDLEVAPGAEAMGDLPLARLVTGNTILCPCASSTAETKGLPSG